MAKTSFPSSCLWVLGLFLVDCGGRAAYGEDMVPTGGFPASASPGSGGTATTGGASAAGTDTTLPVPTGPGTAVSVGTGATGTIVGTGATGTIVGTGATGTIVGTGATGTIVGTGATGTIVGAGATGAMATTTVVGAAGARPVAVTGSGGSSGVVMVSAGGKAVSTVVMVVGGATGVIYGVAYGPDGGPLYPTGDPDPQPLPAREGEPITTSLANIQTLQTQAGTILCGCYQQLYGAMYSSPEQCARDYSPGVTGSSTGYMYSGPTIPPPVTKCINDILNSTSSGDAAVRCQEQALSDLVTCLGAVQCDSQRMDRCQNYYYQQACPAYPYDLEATIQLECWGVTLPPPLLCADGTRINSYLACNGVADCPGGDDESQTVCSVQGYSTIYYPTGYLTCPDGSNLIYDSSELCNGYRLCSDGWDESAATCEAQGIKVFSCNDGRAIRAEWVCDGVPDCSSKEDEAACSAADAGVG